MKLLLVIVMFWLSLWLRLIKEQTYIVDWCLGRIENYLRKERR